jgi:AraC-like DNA-binding protein
MHYQEFTVNDRLADHVQTIWALESENDEEVYPRSLIMPDGIVEFVFHYRQPFYFYQDGIRHIQQENVAVSMMKKYIEIESAGSTGFIAVRCYPWGAYHFFDEPIAGFLDTTIDAQKLWGEASSRVIEDLRMADKLATRVDIVEQFLADQLKRFGKNETETDEALKVIRQSKGMLSIEEVCAQTGINKKQLERKFSQLPGATPKVFSRVCRFLNICNHLDEYKGKSLTALAYECGYYDQSHFINEFKEFSGFTPKEFFEKQNVWFTEI